MFMFHKKCKETMCRCDLGTQLSRPFFGSLFIGTKADARHSVSFLSADSPNCTTPDQNKILILILTYRACVFLVKRMQA